MDFSHANMSSFQQQSNFNNMSKNRSWLLQQPKDSGYASEDYDLFEKAFEAQLHPTVQENQSTEDVYNHMPSSAFSDSSSSNSSPFQYADSLCTYNQQQWNPYDSLNMSVKKMSIDAGISSMSYCDIDSLLTAAYYDTCVTQTNRFQSFSEQHSSPPRASTSVDPHTPTPKTQIIEESESPEAMVRGRPRGRMPHTAVEQRYRQNLNDQFCRLRETVPDIQTAQPARSGQPPKPSKAEVLMGAVDYIKQLEEENQQLRDAMNQALDVRRKRAKTG